MTFDQDLGYSFPLFSSLVKKEGREKDNEVSKIVIMPFCSILKIIFLVTTVDIYYHLLLEELQIYMTLFIRLEII